MTPSHTPIDGRRARLTRGAARESSSSRPAHHLGRADAAHRGSQHGGDGRRVCSLYLDPGGAGLTLRGNEWSRPGARGVRSARDWPGHHRAGGQHPGSGGQHRPVPTTPALRLDPLGVDHERFTCPSLRCARGGRPRRRRPQRQTEARRDCFARVGDPAIATIASLLAGSWSVAGGCTSRPRHSSMGLRSVDPGTGPSSSRSVTHQRRNAAGRASAPTSTCCRRTADASRPMRLQAGTRRPRPGASPGTTWSTHTWRRFAPIGCSRENSPVRRGWPSSTWC